MTSQLSPVDFIVIITSLFSVMLVGFWFALARKQDPFEFTIANRQMSGWVIGLSMMMTAVSSVGFISIPALSFKTDCSLFMIESLAPLAAWLAGKYAIGFYRKQGDISCFAHLKRRFGRWASIYLLSCYAISIVIWMGSILYVLSSVLSVVTNYEITTLIAITGILVTAYTCVGGIKAVIWTDAVQFLFLVLSIPLIIYFTGDYSNHTIAEFTNIAWEAGKFSLGDFSFNLQNKTAWMLAISGFSLCFMAYVITQTYVQRYLAARSTNAAKKGLYLGISLNVMVKALLFFLGAIMFAFYEVFPQELAASADMAQGESVLPYFILTVLPTGFKGLVITAILCAAMSSIDSGINSVSTAVYSEMFLDNEVQTSSSVSPMKTLYALSIATGILSIGLAYILKDVESIIKKWLELNSIFSGGTLGLFLLAFFVPKAKKAAGIFSISIASLVMLWIGFSQHLPDTSFIPKSTLNPMFSLTAGTIATVALGFLWSRLASNKNQTENSHS